MGLPEAQKGDWFTSGLPQGLKCLNIHLCGYFDNQRFSHSAAQSLSFPSHHPFVQYLKKICYFSQTQLTQVKKNIKENMIDISDNGESITA